MASQEIVVITGGEYFKAKAEYVNCAESGYK